MDVQEDVQAAMEPAPTAEEPPKKTSPSQRHSAPTTSLVADMNEHVVENSSHLEREYVDSDSHDFEAGALCAFHEQSQRPAHPNLDFLGLRADEVKR
eukprot:CAMPEP_0204152986 /NCGR_PEP_ID=MMETSP0361-20130328/27460_1 /ASSEMBLY_ACC=CAM_ASM_000343 /TAXON_ID=268821 /ORGANISM="Scrippsiella Hangoei, Strain SHTV-5" /LENGTH=96 /DNA_ID=CAMNT_0051108025 /DNA_START=121 /DNA_END=410 /DNA_ORIENTATION=-